LTVGRSLPGSAPRAEEALEKFYAFGGEDALDDFDAVVEEIAVGDAEFAADSAEAEVAAAEDEAADAGVDQRAGAHDAGFEGDVEGGIGQAVVVERTRSFAEGEEFGVSSWVI